VSAGAIICMDGRDWATIRHAFPGIRNRLFLLRLFAEDRSNLAIEDPWGKGTDAFRTCYSIIARCIEGLMNAITE
jgi:protein-tyrosine-phosphatase